MSEYTVQGGDCLWKIAKNQCGAKTNAEIQAKVNEIAKMNNIANPDLIFTGSTLKLPGDTFETQNTDKNNETKPETHAAATNTNGGTKAAEANVPEANFTVTNPKIFEDFENWRLGYKDALQAFEDNLLDQKGLDAAIFNAGGIKFDFNTEDNYEISLKYIANGLFQSLNKGKGVTYDAFLNWYTQGITTKEKNILMENEDQFKNAFEKLDKDNNSLLDATEMENMFKAFDKMDQTIDGVITNENLTKPNRFTAKNFTNI